MKIEYTKKVKQEITVEEKREIEVSKVYDVNIVEMQSDGTLKTICRVTDYDFKPDEKECAELLIPYIGKKNVFATVFENYKITRYYPDNK